MEAAVTENIQGTLLHTTERRLGSSPENQVEESRLQADDVSKEDHTTSEQKIRTSDVTSKDVTSTTTNTFSLPSFDVGAEVTDQATSTAACGGVEEEIIRIDMSPTCPTLPSKGPEDGVDICSNVLTDNASNYMDLEMKDIAEPRWKSPSSPSDLTSLGPNINGSPVQSSAIEEIIPEDTSQEDVVLDASECHEETDRLALFSCSSLPPSSSPVPIFSSSPLKSSQSSVANGESMNSEKTPHSGAGGSAEILNASLISREAQHAEASSVEAAGLSSCHLRSEQQSGVVFVADPARKRKREESNESNKKDDHVGPNPKRSTLTSQRRQFQKLSTPFRTPQRVATPRPVSSEAVSERIYPKAAPKENESCNKTGASTPTSARANFAAQETPLKQKHRTAKAASQFKSPLAQAASSSPQSSHVRLTPSIQILERKTQLLRRAVKLEQDNEAAVLKELTAKWIEAGREIAWEVWDLVKDSRLDRGKQATPMKWGWDEDKPTSQSQGWSSEDNESRPECEEPSTSVAQEEGEGDHGRDSLGIMLREFGIDPETLGWDGQEETFVN